MDREGMSGDKIAKQVLGPDRRVGSSKDRRHYPSPYRDTGVGDGGALRLVLVVTLKHPT